MTELGFVGILLVAVCGPALAAVYLAVVLNRRR